MPAGCVATPTPTSASQSTLSGSSVLDAAAASLPVSSAPTLPKPITSESASASAGVPGTSFPFPTPSHSTPAGSTQPVSDFPSVPAGFSSPSYLTSPLPSSDHNYICIPRPSISSGQADVTPSSVGAPAFLGVPTPSSGSEVEAAPKKLTTSALSTKKVNISGGGGGASLPTPSSSVSFMAIGALSTTPASVTPTGSGPVVPAYSSASSSSSLAGVSTGNSSIPADDSWQKNCDSTGAPIVSYDSVVDYGWATTTHYGMDADDANGAGACGCVHNKWQQGNDDQSFYTATAPPSIWGSEKGWLGPGCGRCYELTAAPLSVPHVGGDGAPEGTKIQVMITNYCPPATDVTICNKAGGKNKHGAYMHFDLMMSRQEGWVGPNKTRWNNPSVFYKRIECPAWLADNFKECKAATHTITG
ncbi:hypothetical protein PYCC9005_001105 [Savitreella phatthalungensis]